MKLRKHFLFASLLAVGTVWADAGTPVILKSPNEYYITAFSRNGKWACGAYTDYANENYAFRWNLESNEIEMLNPSSPSTPYAVSNTGIVVGQFTDNTYRSNGASMTLAGYWDGKKWVRLEMPSDYDVKYSNAYDISPDGHYITGTVEQDITHFYGYIWEDGKIKRQLEGAKNEAMPYAVSPDGNWAAGWVWGDNRTATIWDSEGKATTLAEQMSPWTSGRKFSEDGKLLLYYGDWTSDNKGIQAIYNVETKEKTTVYPTDTEKSHSIDFFDISNNGTIVGTQDDRAYIYKDNTPYYAEDYLTQHGIDLSKEHILMYEGTDYYQINYGVGISSDDNVMGFRYYNDDKDSNGEYSVSVQSMVVKFNQATSGMAPASVKASQLSGVHSVKVTWSPNVSAQGITGYNVYRDDNKVASVSASDKSYIDANVANGNHKYSVTALYGSTESAKSDEISVSVADRALQSPTGLYAQQHGYNSAYLEWGMPETNFSNLSYFDLDGVNKQTFGVSYENTVFETAIKFDQSTLAAYAGQKLTSVAFYPIEAQNGWTINIYTHDGNGDLKLLKTQPVTQDLKYGERNVVTLSEPLDIPSGDLVIATEVSVSTPSQSIVTLDYGRAVKGYSDLVRVSAGDEADADFYSMGDMMSQMGYDYSASWAIDATIAPEGSDLSKDNVDHYNIYTDGNLTASSKEFKHDLLNLSEGTHSLGVSAVYADGSESAQNTVSLDIKNDETKLAGIDNVKVENSSYTAIKATWAAPIDNDKVHVQYCGETASSAAVTGPEDNNYNLMASAIYPSNTFRGRDGYKITSVRFYPLNDATFTAYLYKNGELVNETEIDDYTLNQWNEIELSEPVELDSKAQYQLVIDCYDVTPEKAPLAVDTDPSVIGYSDLVCVDGTGNTWDTLNNAVIFNNWMIGLGIENPNAAPLSVSGYDVNIDGVKKNSDKLTDTSYSYDFGAPSDDEHTISVDVYYTVKSESVKGGATKFYIGSTGINSTVVGKIEMRQGDNELTVTGDNVTSVDIIATNGATAASAKGNTVSLNGLTSGVYVVKATVNGKTVTRKIIVKK